MTTITILKLFAENNALKKRYHNCVNKHNENVMNDKHSDSGFDLLTPEDQVIKSGCTDKIDYQLKSIMVKYSTKDDIKLDTFEKYCLQNAVASNMLNETYDTITNNGTINLDQYPSLERIPSAFYLYPRSSLGSKTKLRLANSVGIIDSGYRGNLMAVLDNINPNKDHLCMEDDRLVQICTPTLEPFLVTFVSNETELEETTRGSGGFGSTG